MSLYAMGVLKIIRQANSGHRLVDDVLTNKTLCAKCRAEVPEYLPEEDLPLLVQKFKAPCPGCPNV